MPKRVNKHQLMPSADLKAGKITSKQCAISCDQTCIKPVLTSSNGEESKPKSLVCSSSCSIVLIIFIGTEINKHLLSIFIESILRSAQSNFRLIAQVRESVENSIEQSEKWIHAFFGYIRIIEQLIGPTQSLIGKFGNGFYGQEGDNGHR